jgi:hypothetical protein
MPLEASDYHRKRFDPRTRRDRVHLQNLAWAEQIEQLVDAYLLWRIQPIASDTPSVGETKTYSISTVDFFCEYCNHPCSMLYWLIRPSDTGTMAVALHANDDYPNLMFARRGYLGTTPRSPKMAIAFSVLEAYRQLHRVCPKLSVYAQVQALCYLHQVSITHTSFMTCTDSHSITS